jgi:hypothetical protein
MDSFTPSALYPQGNNPLPSHSLYTRLGGPNIESGRCDEATNIPPLPSFMSTSSFVILARGYLAMLLHSFHMGEYQMNWKEAVET